MQVIHFTRGATDPLKDFCAKGTGFVPLVDGGGDAHVSCLHLSAGAQISEPPATHDCALLVVHGHVIMTVEDSGARLDLYSGVGAVLKAGEHYGLESPLGAIVLAVESQRLEPTRRGISTPGRIAGQRWPGEDVSPTKSHLHEGGGQHGCQ
jgi:hypothetical protein